MLKNNQPVYTLTTEEFKEVIKSVAKEAVKEVMSENQHLASSKKDIIFIDEVCQITNYKKPTIYMKVGNGDMPVLSRNKPLTFSRREVEEWLKNGKPSPSESIDPSSFLKK